MITLVGSVNKLILATHFRQTGLDLVHLWLDINMLVSFDAMARVELNNKSRKLEKESELTKADQYPCRRACRGLMSALGW